MNLKFIVAGFVGALAVGAAPMAHAQGADSALLDALVQKGVLTNREAKEIQSKDQQAYDSTAASKISLGSSIKSITFYGDLRMRYEMRDGTGPANSEFSSAGTPIGHPESETLNRWRYRLRLGMKGTLYDNFFFGVRVATNPYYDRSGNVTFGHSDAAGPFGKGFSLLGIDQVYLGWHATSDITLTGGQMPNPLYSTSLVWDDNLNPAGAAEQYDHGFGNGLEVFATAGQFVYQAGGGNGITNTIGGSFNYSNTFMFAEQVGFKFNFDKDTFFKAAGTLYTYSGTVGTESGTPSVSSLYSTSPLVLGSTAPAPENNSPSYFNGPFVGSASAPASNVSGINDLAVLDFPMEFDFRIGPGSHTVTSASSDPKDMKDVASSSSSFGWSLPVRVFADFAYNLEADQRADAARQSENDFLATNASSYGVDTTGTAAGNAALVSSQGFEGVLHSGKGFLDQAAYQVGIEAGQLKKKGDWDGKLYWQSIGYYSLDPNLIDADIFNAATNMQGIVASVSHNWTDGFSSTLRYANAERVNGHLATPNVNQDVTMGTIAHYNLFQADVMWKF